MQPSMRRRRWRSAHGAASRRARARSATPVRPSIGAAEPTGLMRPMRLTRLIGLIGGVAVLALVSGCSGTGDERAVATTTIPNTVPPELAVGANVTVPVTLPVPDNFIAPDTRSALIPPVLSKYTAPDGSRPTLPVEGGTARISGVVYGPDGPLEGAVVRLERFVGAERGQLDVGTNKDGRYDAGNLLGGRYRVRAWQKPSLATIEPPALFLAADHGQAVMDIVTEKHDGESLQGALDVPDPHVGQKVTFRALLAKEDVNDDGIVVGKGIEGRDVQLTPVDGVKVDGEGVQQTGGDGIAAFTLICEGVGEHSVIIGSGDKALAVGLPPCLEGDLSIEDVLGTSTTTAPPAGTPTTAAPPTTRPATTAPPTTRPTTTAPATSTTKKPVKP